MSLKVFDTFCIKMTMITIKSEQLTTLTEAAVLLLFEILMSKRHAKLEMTLDV